MRVLLTLQVFSTLAMFGLIWFVQVVHYPLFARVGRAEALAYEEEHARRTSWVVAPLMLVELASAGLLVYPGLRLPIMSATGVWVGAALVGVIWGSTGLIQVPLHNRLHGGYSEATVRKLVLTNWIRTAAWSARAGLVLVWAWRAF